MADTSILACIDLDVYLADPTSDAAKAECEKAALALQSTGALVLKTSRVTPTANAEFLDMFEDYFAQDRELLQKDERPEYGYQVGTTLEHTEKPKCHSNDECQAVIKGLDAEERPLDLTGEFKDPKCRFFYRMGDKAPYPSEFNKLNMDNVIPEKFTDVWEEKCTGYGTLLKTSVESVAEMAAIGFGLDKSAFREAGKYGPHLLAPTATDLVKYGELGAIFAGFHTDLNFLTIHGQSRYPGLHIWARNSGKKIVARVPPGCLLVQAGKQMEILTGGLVKAGYHEVCYTQQTDAAVQKRKAEFPDRPLIRISSTFFWHLTSDFVLEPIPSLVAQAGALRQKNGEDTTVSYDEWKGVKVGQQVQIELGLIALMA